MSAPLPRLYRIREKFSGEILADVAGDLSRALDETGVLGSVKPGARVLVAVGSRGIPNNPTVEQRLTRIL